MDQRQLFMTRCLSRHNSSYVSLYELAQGLFICQYKYTVISLRGLSVSGQFTEWLWKERLVSHREPTCLPSHFSFNFWPWVKMAASHTDRLGSQFDQFSGSQETSASLSVLMLSLAFSLSLAICLQHVDGVTEMASCASSCCALITRFKGSRVSPSLSLSWWQRRRKWSSTPPAWTPLH